MRTGISITVSPSDRRRHQVPVRDHNAAQKQVWRALVIVEKALGPDHPHVAASLENYAALLRKTGRSDEAARMEARAKAIRAKRAERNTAN